jgi:hypothetical protein
MPSQKTELMGPARRAACAGVIAKSLGGCALPGWHPMSLSISAISAETSIRLVAIFRGALE